MRHEEQAVARHYGGPDLLSTILTAARMPDGTLSAERVAMMDEFHIGGAAATERLLDGMALAPGARLLDIGSGVGGPARHAARRGLTVTGIDLTPRFVEAARALTAELGGAGGPGLVQAEFVQGSALDLPFGAESFDAAMMLHVGMNIADKRALMQSVARVLRPGGIFAIYDILRLQDGDLAWPLPWAATEETSFLAPEAHYRAAAEGAGLRVTLSQPRREEAMAFFAAMKAAADDARAAGRPPPPGIGVVMGDSAGVKLSNLIQAIAAGLIAPVEIHLQKPDVG